jgi:alkylhydroperoxidase/carboxymuconolactone decarboxylase family protein YurZ
MSDAKTPAFTVPLGDRSRAVIAAVEGKRGYTLPYHRMFAAWAPDLLATYDAFYEELTLKPRVLTPREKETVWAALLAAAREVHGFIHMQRALAAGLSQGDIARAVALAAITESFAVMDFSATNWSAWTLPDDLEQRYLSAFDAVRGDLSPALAHLAGLVAMGARRDRRGTVLHLRHAFAAGITQAQVCEGLSYMMIPCGGNTLIEAVSYWEDAARDGLVPPPY